MKIQQENSPPSLLRRGEVCASLRYGATAGIRSYDVTADGRRFLMVQQKERPAADAAEMILVQNWLEEVKTRVPVK